MVKVKRMEKKEVIKIKDFKKHGDIRLLHYNFEYKTVRECRLWYKAKNKLLRRYIFSVYNDNTFVGYITLKNINWFIKRAEMGIVINPSYIDKGIGTEVIKKYLEIVFTKYKMKSIYLRVADFNYRARKCYEKVGFVKYKESYDEYEEQEYLLVDDEYKKFNEMIYKDGVIYTKYYYMIFYNEL